MQMPRRIQRKPVVTKPPMTPTRGVWRNDDEPAAGPEDTSAFAQQTDWIVHVLNDVAGDDRIEGPIWEALFLQAAGMAVGIGVGVAMTAAFTAAGSRSSPSARQPS